MIDREALVGVAQVAELVLLALRPASYQGVLEEREAEVMIHGHAVIHDRQRVDRRLGLVDPEKGAFQRIPSKGQRQQNERSQEYRLSQGPFRAPPLPQDPRWDQNQGHQEGV